MRSKRGTSALAKSNTGQVRRKTKRRGRGPHNALARAFLKRSVKMLERVSSSASSETLESALSAPTDVGGVATLLSDLAPLAMEVPTLDPFVEAMARGAAIKQELLTSAGGGLTSGQAGRA